MRFRPSTAKEIAALFDPTEIIGIDPGFKYPAACALDAKGKILRLQAWDGSDSRGMEMSARSHKVAAVISRWIVAVPGPKVIGIEGPAVNVRRFKAVEMMARLRQSIFDHCAFYLPDFIHFEIPPAAAKVAATGVGNADKEMVARAVQQIYRISLPSGKDARYATADAVAIAMSTRGQWQAKSRLEGSA